MEKGFSNLGQVADHINEIGVPSEEEMRLVVEKNQEGEIQHKFFDLMSKEAMSTITDGEAIILAQTKKSLDP
jgi:hypothetical protein